MKKSLIAGLMVLASPMNVAAEEITAQELKGKIYGALNYNRFVFDDNRQTTNPKLTDIGTEYGFGGAVGYRIDESFEVRFGYTDVHVQQTSGSSSLDLLYFMDQKGIYFLGGVNYLEVEDDKTSLNFGGGYRHHINEDFAVFVEGKANFNTSTSNTDYSTGIGVMYFFGGF